MNDFYIGGYVGMNTDLKVAEDALKNYLIKVEKQIIIC